MNANNAKDITVGKSSATVGASQTNSPISNRFGTTAGGSARAMRLDVLTGVVAITSAATAKHQHTNLAGLWTDGKTVSITGSTDTSATADATTDQITATSHGLVEDQPLVVSATSMPGGVTASQIYWAKVVDANTIQLKSAFEGQPLDITSAGTSVKVTAVRVFTITYLPNVAGDQAHMPLRSSGRAVLTTGAGDSVQVLKVVLNQED